MIDHFKLWYFFVVYLANMFMMHLENLQKQIQICPLNKHGALHKTLQQNHNPKGATPVIKNMYLVGTFSKCQVLLPSLSVSVEPKAEITKFAFIFSVCSSSSIHVPSSN